MEGGGVHPVPPKCLAARRTRGPYATRFFKFLNLLIVAINETPDSTSKLFEIFYLLNLRRFLPNKNTAFLFV